jgi:prevent-host-death family protein
MRHDLSGTEGSDLSDTVESMARMTATDAARSFSDLLNRVAAGEEIEVTRNGATVAVIGPTRARLVSAARFRELVSSAPHPDQDFADDVRDLREAVRPPEDPWAS